MLGCEYIVSSGLFFVPPGLWVLKTIPPRVPLRYTRGQKYFVPTALADLYIFLKVNSAFQRKWISKSNVKIKDIF
jgi:hypothetical protein